MPAGLSSNNNEKYADKVNTLLASIFNEKPLTDIKLPQNITALNVSNDFMNRGPRIRADPLPVANVESLPQFLHATEIQGLSFFQNGPICNRQNHCLMIASIFICVIWSITEKQENQPNSERLGKIAEAIEEYPTFMDEHRVVMLQDMRDQHVDDLLAKYTNVTESLKH